MAKTWTIAGGVFASVLLAGGSASADVVIAVAGPMSGQYAAFGDQMRQGAEMAVKHLNAAGGVAGQKLVLEVGDDACDPKQAVAVANNLARKKVVLVAGHFCSGSSIPASQVYVEENILQISPASTNPTLTDRGYATVFRVCGRDDQQGPYAADFLMKSFAGKRVAIIHDKQSYSKGLADSVKASLNKAGVQESLYETITPGERDYTSVVTKLKSLNVDVLYYGGYHTEAALIVRQMREQGLTIPMMSGDALNSNEFWSITGAAGEGYLFTFGPDPRLKPEAQTVVEAFRKTGYDPEGYTLYTYAAIQAWAEAVKTAGSVSAPKVADALRAGSFKTVIGALGFNAKGDRKSTDYVVYRWHDGAYTQIADKP